MIDFKTNRFLQIIVFIIVGLIGVWLIYSYAMHLPSEAEIIEVERLY